MLIKRRRRRGRRNNNSRPINLPKVVIKMIESESAVALSMCRVGTCVPPTNTKFKPLLLPTQTGMPYTNTHKHRTSYFKSTLHLWDQLSSGSAFPQPDKNRKFLRFFIINIREYGSTLYVGLARAVSPTNTNFRLTFLLTRLQEALYEDSAV